MPGPSGKTSPADVVLPSESVRLDKADRTPNYDKYPFVPAGSASDLAVGWEEISARISSTGARLVVLEAYPGVHSSDLEEVVRRIDPDLAVAAEGALKPPEEIELLVAPDVTQDPVFGRITKVSLSDFFDTSKLARLRQEVVEARGRVVVYGTGAALVAQGGVLVYADLTRWEIQQRQRRNEISNLGSQDFLLEPSLKYKRAFFVDWRVADRHKKSLFEGMDFILDTCDSSRPKMAEAQLVWSAVQRTARRPFRVIPFFDPAPWGGEWMRTVCDLDRDTINYGWCFDCVPEENSLLLGFGSERLEIPSIDLVFRHPKELLGEEVFETFGSEFPIRFDFLDTMDGGNLSLQVHPLTAYIREQFGMGYTQDESYYLLDADVDATVYLGLKEGIDPNRMVDDLRRAQAGGYHFPDENYVNRFPAKRHDHFLIPAGTVHCSGRNSLVLEISATPYIFTFKLWDWDRLGLDGRPRPIHLEHGVRSIQWDRDTPFVQSLLMNRFSEVSSGDGWRQERTGLHDAEFIETRRHWFTGTAPHEAGSGVNVLNLVQGEEAEVVSPEGAFDAFPVHYAETFIVPAEAGPYTVQPAGRAFGTRCATIKAFVRPRAGGAG
ncbi:MAG: class I mannose-6-phosphate isomerase [Actinomycetota bacterium]